MGFGVVALSAIGLFLAAFTSVSLFSGSGTVWIGVALAAIGTAGAFFLGADDGIRVIAVICLVLALASGVYTEYQLDQKRRDISDIFNGS